MKNEEIQKWASIAEIVAAIAVVLSLIYVALEINSNTRALQSSSRQEFAALDIAVVTPTLDPSTLAQAIDKYSNAEELTRIEESHYYRYQQLQLRIFENAYYQFRIGALEENAWNRYREYLARRVCANEYAREVSTIAAFEFEFTAIIEEIVDSCE